MFVFYLFFFFVCFSSFFLYLICFLGLAAGNQLSKKYKNVEEVFIIFSSLFLSGLFISAFSYFFFSCLISIYIVMARLRKRKKKETKAKQTHQFSKFNKHRNTSINTRRPTNSRISFMFKQQHKQN
jgi:hypothetical protein